METVGRVLWLWYPAFSLPLFPKTPLSRKSRRGGKMHLSQKRTWVLAAVAHSHTACLLRAWGLKAGGQALCMAESRAHRRQPTNHGSSFSLPHAFWQAFPWYRQVERGSWWPQVLSYGALPFSEGKEGRREPGKGPFGYSFSTCKQKLDAHFWPELILLSQMGGGWGGPSYNPTFSSCSLNQLSPCQRREPVAQFHCNQK